MEVGAMFFAEGKGRAFTSYVSRRGAELDRVFTTQKCQMVKGSRGWRYAKEDELEFASEGIAVWRVE